MSNQQMMQTGDEITVTVTDMAYGGDGVARYEGQVVFVPLTAPGDVVRVVITSAHKKFLRAAGVEWLAQSPDRAEPRCPWYAECAGCVYQHLTYERQQHIKENHVRELFRRLGGIEDPPVRKLVAAASPYGYRARITLHGPGQPAYIGRDGHTHVPVTSCAIAASGVNEALATWRATHPEGLADHEDLCLRAAEGEEQIGPWRFRVPDGSFFQVHAGMTLHLVEATRTLVRACHARVLVDAYCGVGLFAVALGSDVEHVIGIESDHAAVAAAEENARRHHVPSARFIAAPVERELGRVMRTLNPEETCVLLDPPRSGCAPKALDTVARHGPAHVLYVSCAPDAQARDARKLIAAGYTLESVTPFDMFPQTAHVEALAHFSKTTPSAV